MNNQQRIRTVGLRSHGGYMPEGSTDDCFAPEQRIGSVCDQPCIQGIPQGTSAAARSSPAVKKASVCYAHSPAQIRNVFLSHQQSSGIAGIPNFSMASKQQEMASLDNKVTACRWPPHFSRHSSAPRPPVPRVFLYGANNFFWNNSMAGTRGSNRGQSDGLGAGRAFFWSAEDRTTFGFARVSFRRIENFCFG